MRLLLYIIVAGVVGYTASVLINASVSAATLVGFGIDVSFSDRVDMIRSEWLGLSSSYFAIYIGVNLLVYWALNRLLSTLMISELARYAVFGLAGAISIMAVHLAFDAAMGLNGVLVASSRSTAGLLAHSATGGLSGLVFAFLSRRRDVTQ